MRRLALLTVAALLGACSQTNSPPQTSAPTAAATSGANVSSSHKAAAEAVARHFGRQMQKISVLAPPATVRAELPKVYGDLLSPELLATWQANPAQVVGREGSSPWPEKIEIDQVECADRENCRVIGKVDYVTSNEVEHGGVFMRRGITLAVARQDHGWRITSVHLAPAER